MEKICIIGRVKGTDNKIIKGLKNDFENIASDSTIKNLHFSISEENNELSVKIVFDTKNVSAAEKVEKLLDIIDLVKTINDSLDAKKIQIGISAGFENMESDILIESNSASQIAEQGEIIVHNSAMTLLQDIAKETDDEEEILKQIKDLIHKEVYEIYRVY